PSSTSSSRAMKAVPPKTANLRALATTWIVALGVVALAEILLRRAGPAEYVREEEQLLAYQSGKIEKLAPGTILLLGDSSLCSDLDASVLSGELALPVANLALVASFTTMGDAFLLEHALRLGRRPRAIVLFHTPDMWPRPFEENFYQMLQRAT